MYPKEKVTSMDAFRCLSITVASESKGLPLADIKEKYTDSNGEYKDLLKEYSVLEEKIKDVFVVKNLHTTNMVKLPVVAICKIVELDQEVYQLHYKEFIHCTYRPKQHNAYYQMDIVDMGENASHGKRYIRTLIDAFTSQGC
jgi:hypothetical protein